ncbi:unnamed protein product [Rotaria sordida]|uniref:Uncharacterized protein n=1 Tax=Rotaria sordida TaxID=392033 RepID=A0A819NBQ9_9BILA|nr:unnamed protein product [Rotaria sordida]CAF0941863.1 unnamed protein product [Rotaria sordida]CAF3966924.1 unnamed protein product [Rotaria sordida]CAF3996201.1 unnamed protein product [Rotaria sordida]
MTGSKAHSWKILVLRREHELTEKAEEYLHEMGYKNAQVIAIENDKTNDDKLIELLKRNDWDGVSIGGGINGFDDKFPKEVTTLHWFNRLVNLVHEHAPNAKLIFVTGPDDIIDSYERVLGSLEKPIETI